MNRAVGAALAILALAACNRPADLNHEGKKPVKGQNGTVANLSRQSPRDLPSYAQIYPGAKVTMNIQHEHGGDLAYEVAVPPETVMAFYKAAAAKANLTDQMDTARDSNEPSSAHVILFSDPAGGQRSLLASVKAESGVTRVGLTYGD
jgi:hypothetical protein